MVAIFKGSPMSDKPNRKRWSKLPVPFGLADILYMVAAKHGYRREHIHYFLYDLLKTKYPADVEKLADFLETRWMDDKPSDD
jgi:hypothetical protein